MSRILVTGAAGFIGSHLAGRLLSEGHEVVGVDNLDPYYDVRLKRARLALLAQHSGFGFLEADLAAPATSELAFARGPFACVYHLAAQAGVRACVDNPEAYVTSNLVAFAQLIEACRRHRLPHFLYASSSSVYGANRAIPYSEHQPADHPLSLYGATKRANELIAHAYAWTHGLPCTGFRFFTVYGPWGRPDMAYYAFTRAILASEPIDLYGGGEMRRDFTYIDDVVEALVRAAFRPPPAAVQWTGDLATSPAPFRLYNVGNSRPQSVLDLIHLLEGMLGRKAVLRDLPAGRGEVQTTWADASDFSADLGFRPSTSLEEGLGKFLVWYQNHHGLPQAGAPGGGKENTP